MERRRTRTDDESIEQRCDLVMCVVAECASEINVYLFFSVTVLFAHFYINQFTVNYICICLPLCQNGMNKVCVRINQL